MMLVCIFVIYKITEQLHLERLVTLNSFQKKVLEDYFCDIFDFAHGIY